MIDDYIDSRQNPQIKNLARLRERRHRERQEHFLVEGLRELGHAVDAGVDVEAIYYCPEHFPSDAHAAFIDARRATGTTRCVRLSPPAFEKVAYREGPDGILGLAASLPHGLEQLVLPANPLLLILEGIEKPGNLGAILRSADAAGVDAVILSDCIIDLFNPNAIRASQGLVFALPIAVTTNAKLLEWLTASAIQIVVTTPDTEQTYWEINYTEGTAILFGSESAGLSRELLEHGQKIRIPMLGRADSLNVAAASAVCLYEARRQRGPAPRGVRDAP